MEMHQVRYFLAVAQERNFTRAAEACHVTQPSLTRAIQKLEEEFGGQLFRRERALTHLTELGRLMHPLLARSYEAAQQARVLARQVERAQLAPLSLGLAADVSLPDLPLLFADMGTRVAGFELAFRVGEADAIVEAALAGDVDAFIVAAETALPERIEHWELRQERYGLLLPAAHALADASGELAPSGVTGLALISLGSPTEATLFDAGAQARHRAGSVAAAGLLVAAGLGAALVPEGALRPEGTRWRALAGPGVARTVMLAAVAGRRRSAAADIFLKSVRARGWPLPSATQ
jgi:LysR family hydrogen peroxide-inducible transcriptional activator